jgi:hypothetical protein
MLSGLKSNPIAIVAEKGIKRKIIRLREFRESANRCK